MTIEDIGVELVNIIRETADDESSAGTVGKDCHIIYMPGAGDVRSCDYRLVPDTAATTPPHYVIPGAALRDLELAPAPFAPSAATPVEEWPVLDADVTFTETTVRIKNSSDVTWDDVRLDVNGRPGDFHGRARGLVWSTGYFYRVPTLAAHAHIDIGLQALTRPPDGRALPYGARIDSWLLTARLPSGLVGKYEWPRVQP
jgi:hypothetical protein